MGLLLRDNWTKLSLVKQFALAGGVVMVTAAMVVGALLTDRIEKVVTRNTANSTALYMESFIAPLAQELATQDQLSDKALADVKLFLSDTPLGQRVASFKIWRKDGLVVGASNVDLIGKSFLPSENLRLAWLGEVRADFDKTGDPEDLAEHALGLPLLEIYSPIREVKSGRIIAVVEFYEIASQLQRDLNRSRIMGWLAVLAAMALIGGSLFVVVRRGSNTIDRQVNALRELADRNLDLRLRVQSAAGRFSSENDRLLRRIGADLHDGPAQLMGFVALRLDALRGQIKDPKIASDMETVQRAVSDAILEIRNISRGLSLPDLEHKPLEDILGSAVDAHSVRTDSSVRLILPDIAVAYLPIALKICCFRFVQEGLNNAWRHGAGMAQEVELRIDDNVLRLCVRDRGPGFGNLPFDPAKQRCELGLAGLTDRVQSLGGDMVMANRTDGTGALLCMQVDLSGVA